MRLPPLVDRLWTALSEAATIQAEIGREVTRLNQLLGTPRFKWGE